MTCSPFTNTIPHRGMAHRFPERAKRRLIVVELMGTAGSRFDPIAVCIYLKQISRASRVHQFAQAAVMFGIFQIAETESRLTGRHCGPRTNSD